MTNFYPKWVYDVTMQKQMKDMGAGMMKVYLDVFYLVNFFMNLLIFAIMNIFLKKKPLCVRNLCASAVGALEAVMVILAGIREMAAIWIFTYLLASALIIRIAYGKTTVSGFVKYLLGYYITGVFLAGALMFLRGFSGTQNISILFLLISALLILIFAQKLILLRNHGISNEQNVFSVRIHYCGKSVTATGFLDTGNNLYEPISHECVTVVEYNLFKKMLSEEEREQFTKAIYDREPEVFGKLLLRYIPFHSLGKKCDYLLGVRADNMEIKINDKETIQTGKVWLGISDQFLSSDSGYEVLLNSRLFTK